MMLMFAVVSAAVAVSPITPRRIRHGLTPDGEKLSRGRIVIYAGPQMIPGRNTPDSLNVRFDHGGNVIAAVTRIVLM